MKKIAFLFVMVFLWKLNLNHAAAQHIIFGRVVDEGNERIEGVTLRLVHSGVSVISNANGEFKLVNPAVNDMIETSHVAFYKTNLKVSSAVNDSLLVRLKRKENILQEVEINTGYYAVPKERATGSFGYIDNETLNRSVGANILERLEGVANSLLFDRRNFERENIDDAPELRLRGVSRIEEGLRGPLIVIDNFPFEGDIESINPNDVKDVTILKDAAAASIWGAQAGNGVIVINTKRGDYNQPVRISWKSNLNVIEKPDLLYSQSYLPAPVVMEIQKEIFEAGGFSEGINSTYPSYVDLLIRRRDGELNETEFKAEELALQLNDLRIQSSDHLYQRAVNQQYGLNVSGGGGSYNFFVAASHDRSRERIIGNHNFRTNLTIQNAYKIADNLEVSGSVYLSDQGATNNGIGFNASASIYEALIDQEGNPRHIAGINKYRREAEDMGLLDWLDRPLDRRHQENHTSTNRALRINGVLKYRFLKNFTAIGSYQLTQTKRASEDFYRKNSFFVRNLVNRFTQPNMSLVIPHNAIRDYNASQFGKSHSGRFQVNYLHNKTDDHELAMLAGAEIREALMENIPGMRIYNLDEDLWTGTTRYDYTTRFQTRPSGGATIPLIVSSPNLVVNRNLSYFSNGSYAYKQKYVLSSSLRWDGSNLLGVSANQRGTLLWSVGASWEASKEPFYSANQLPYLRLRATYGVAGNIDKSQSHYPTILVGTNTITQLSQSILMTPGNPSLRWEEVNTLNLALDWKSNNQRLSGSVEFYNKQANQLLGESLMDPTTGVNLTSGYKKNYAGLQTWGWDLELRSRNLQGVVAWNTSLLASTSKNKISYINVPRPLMDSYYVTIGVWEVGESVDKLYAYPWNGLREDNGMPVIYRDGALSSDYAGYVQNVEKSELVMEGTQVPVVFGSIRNSLSWNGLSLDFLIGFRAGHVFRRKSLAPGQEYQQGVFDHYHLDYFQRWKAPGDERRTNIPASGAFGDPNNIAISSVYAYTAALVEPADALRLQDVRLSFAPAFKSRRARRMDNSSITVFAYARNLGIIWKANNKGIDPDYPNASYPAPPSFALGLEASF